MLTHTFEGCSETEVTYLRDRVASLEFLVRELLVKNERLRFVLEVDGGHGGVSTPLLMTFGMDTADSQRTQ